MTEYSVNFVGIGRATLIDDTGDLQLVQVTEGAAGGGFADRITDKVRRVAEFGFASVPPIGAEVLMLRRGGDRSRSMVVGTSHRPSRPRGLQPGDSGIYDVRGRKITLTADGVTVDGAGGVVTVTNASKVRCTCDIETTGDVRCRADGQAVSLGALHDAYNLHHHKDVQAGTALSGTTDQPL
jgi:phage baseplate assembly protein V